MWSISSTADTVPLASVGRFLAFGPAFTAATIRATLDAFHLPHAEHGDVITDALARRLADGAVANWFQARMEAGPRALGQRSIAADPRSIATRERINRRSSTVSPGPFAPHC